MRAGSPAGELIGGASISLPLPLLNRNQGGVATAKAQVALESARLDRQALLAKAQVERARTQVATATATATTLKENVVDKQQEMLSLLERAYDAGKLGVTDVLLRQRSVLNAQAAYVNALSDVAAARAQLAYATGALSSRVRSLSSSSSQSSSLD